MSTQIKKNGNWVTVAGGTRMWVGTKAALQAALDAGELVDGTAVMVTDDYDEQEMSGTLANSIQAAKPFNYVKKGSVVSLDCIMDGGLSAWVMPTPNTWVTVATLPEGCRPANRIYVSDQGANPCVRWIIEENGSIECYYLGAVTPGWECTLHATFVVA